MIHARIDIHRRIHYLLDTFIRISSKVKKEVKVEKSTPDFNCSIEDTVAEGDKVITRFSMRGTHEGEWQGIPPTGNKVETSAIFITRIENGKIVEHREEENSLGFMMKLGMELKPKEGEK